jgi:hypothetical protein
MPKRKRTHTAKWDRCVKAVKKSSKGYNPYAVCTASLGQSSFLRKPNNSVKKVVKHLKHDILEAKDGIRRDKRSLASLKKEFGI